jgi:DNA transformation protein
MQQLADLPNIGKVIEAKLKEVGIECPEQLLAIGAEKTFIRFRAIDKGACLSMLCGLEGAIQGIRWHQLPKERKEALKAFMRMK